LKIERLGPRKTGNEGSGKKKREHRRPLKGKKKMHANARWRNLKGKGHQKVLGKRDNEARETKERSAVALGAKSRLGPNPGPKSPSPSCALGVPE